jgi:hypothetical protein
MFRSIRDREEKEARRVSATGLTGRRLPNSVEAIRWKFNGHDRVRSKWIRSSKWSNCRGSTAAVVADRRWVTASHEREAPAPVAAAPAPARLRLRHCPFRRVDSTAAARGAGAREGADEAAGAALSLRHQPHVHWAAAARQLPAPRPCRHERRPRGGWTVVCHHHHWTQLERESISIKTDNYGNSSSVNSLNCMDNDQVSHIDQWSKSTMLI